VKGLGVDVVDLERFASALARRPSIGVRLFTDAERSYCDLARVPTKRAERYAGRFAVKEAVHKALGCGIGSFRWQDVEVERAESGAPSIALHGVASELAAACDITRWHVSITHDRLVAVAVVVGE
jgi:holo-[acyl-carrier protein] synthase